MNISKESKDWWSRLIRRDSGCGGGTSKKENKIMNAKTYNARIGHQISVFLENRPGTLGSVIDVLREAGINMLALSLSEGLEIGYLRVTVDKLAEAREALKNAKHLVLEREVLLLEVVNEPGGLASVIDRLSSAGINVEYAYSADSPTPKTSMIIVRVADPAAALKVLLA